MKNFRDLREKKLTPAEMKKREKIAKAMERDNPGMDMSKKMAIATATAKRVAEQSLDEGSRDIKQPGPHPDMVKAGIKHTHRQSPFKKSKTYVTVDKKDHAKAKKVLGNQTVANGGNVYLEIKEEVELDEISQKKKDDYVAKASADRQSAWVKKDMADRTKDTKTSDAMKKKMAKRDKGMYRAMAKEAYEDNEPASPDEASMAMRQLGFIEYAAEEVMDHIKSGKEFPEWMQNKLSKLHGQMESLYSALGERGEDDEEMKEATEISELSDKKLDAYRQKAFADQPSGDDGSDKYRKRKFGRDLAFDKQVGRAKVRATKEEVAANEATELDELNKKTLGSYVKKASRDVANRSADNARDYATGNRPVGMNKKAMKNWKREIGIDMAIDKMTKEEVQIDEGIENMPHARLKWHMNTGVPHGRYTKAELKKEKDRRLSKVDTHTAYKKAKPSMNEESLDITEISLDMLTKKVSNTNLGNVRKAMKTDKVKTDLATLRKKLDNHKGMKPIKAQTEAKVDEAKRKGAPKMTGDSFAIQRAKDAELNKALGRTKTGRKKPARQMTSTQRSLASLRNEAVVSADKKPEKYVKPDGKVGIRMVRVDKQVIKKDA